MVLDNVCLLWTANLGKLWILKNEVSEIISEAWGKVKIVECNRQKIEKIANCTLQKCGNIVRWSWQIWKGNQERKSYYLF